MQTKRSSNSVSEIATSQWDLNDTKSDAFLKLFVVYLLVFHYSEICTAIDIEHLHVKYLGIYFMVFHYIGFCFVSVHT